MLTFTVHSSPHTSDAISAHTAFAMFMRKILRLFFGFSMVGAGTRCHAV